jgi:hypothetical protein
MLRTLLPLSLLIVGLAAQDPPPVPQIRRAFVLQQQAFARDFQHFDPAALAKADWLLPGSVAEPKWTLYVCMTAVQLRDQRGWLEDLHKRFGERGARIAAVLTRDDAKAVAASRPPFAVGGLDEATALNGTSWFAVGTQAPTLAGVDGAADLLQAVADGRNPDTLLAALAMLPRVLNSVGDGGDARATGMPFFLALPHSGRARAWPVLAQWWGGDLVAARKQFDAGMEALANEPWALAVFADLVLRGDRSDPSYARELALALTPVATAAPDNPFVQLVQLRALLRAGQDKLAGRMLSLVGKLCDGDPRNQVLYAETLMEANEPAPYRTLAEHALEAAAAATGFDPQWIVAARHKVLVRSGAPAAECDRLLADYRAAARMERGTLNGDAWGMMTRLDTMGRFDTYALGQCEELQRLEGAGIDYASKDTVALALFVNGRLQQAVELQTEASAASGNDPRFTSRLERFKNTLAAQQAKKPSAK